MSSMGSASKWVLVYANFRDSDSAYVVESERPIPRRSSGRGISGSTTLRPNSSLVSRCTIARSRTVEPHCGHEGCSRCSAAKAMLLDEPQIVQQKSICGPPVGGERGGYSVRTQR